MKIILFILLIAFLGMRQTNIHPCGAYLEQKWYKKGKLIVCYTKATKAWISNLRIDEYDGGSKVIGCDSLVYQLKFSK